ncbi:hypothetical protein QOZ80_2AG0112610 [Eleusine coracana subsp. coracana]|nr:hypothetical protein QOZ80_2AG0112610 [Eleusine coracana subsp. coracana]
MKKGKWSQEEDYLIRNHIEKHGIGRSWQALSNTLGLQRCGRSCRSRWLNYLRPGLKHGNFTPAEDKIICEMYSKRGSCWSVIASQLPGRTDLAIKNYWNSTLKKRFSAARKTSARRRPRPSPTASTSSDAATPARNLQMVVYSDESSSAGSSCAKPALLASSLVLAAGREPEPIEVVPVTVRAPVRAEQKPSAVGSLPLTTTPPPAAACRDQAGEMGMDIICVPMSPLPLGFMDPELARLCGFDDIHSFLPWFDRH